MWSFKMKVWDLLDRLNLDIFLRDIRSSHKNPIEFLGSWGENPDKSIQEFKEVSISCDLKQESNWPRGKMVGGSGQMNFLIHSTGSTGDYDSWQVDGWDSHSMKMTFDRMACWMDADSSTRSFLQLQKECTADFLQPKGKLILNHRILNSIPAIQYPGESFRDPSNGSRKDLCGKIEGVRDPLWWWIWQRIPENPNDRNRVQTRSKWDPNRIPERLMRT